MSFCRYFRIYGLVPIAYEDYSGYNSKTYHAVAVARRTDSHLTIFNLKSKLPPSFLNQRQGATYVEVNWWWNCDLFFNNSDIEGSCLWQTIQKYTHTFHLQWTEKVVFWKYSQVKCPQVQLAPHLLMTFLAPVYVTLCDCPDCNFWSCSSYFCCHQAGGRVTLG